LPHRLTQKFEGDATSILTQGDIVEWDRVIVKYWSFSEFVYEVIHMNCSVEWYIMGRLG